jgi:stress-induced morphogen
VFVISSSFEGKRVLERHKLVNAALAPLMPEIHALSIRKAKTPQEEEALQQQEQGQGQGQKQ